MSRKGIPNGTTSARRIGTIGYEIGADFAARKCAEFARQMGAVMVAVDDDYACWAMLPGSREATAILALEQDSVLGTYVKTRVTGELGRAIAEDIRHRMGELGGGRLAA